MAEFSFTYRAFISYSYGDRDWGVWLHKALEAYRIPRRLSGPETPRRLGKVFRDEEDLGAAAKIGPELQAVLNASDAMIVICSPRSAKSRWVNDEINAFRALGREDRIFALIVDGSPHGADGEDCFPDALKVDASGAATEPLAIDVRKFGREDAVLRLVAGMLGVGYDDLRQREVRKRRAEMFRAQAILATGVILMAAALAGGWFTAVNYVNTSERDAGFFAREANVLFDEGDHAKAMLMALYGDPAAQRGWLESTLRSNGYSTTLTALERAHANLRLQATLKDHKGDVASVAFSPDGKLIATGSRDHQVRLWNAATGQFVADLRSAHAPEPEGDGSVISAIVFSPDGSQLTAATLGMTTETFSLAGNEPRSIKLGEFYSDLDEDRIEVGVAQAMAISSDGALITGAVWNELIEIWSGEPDKPSVSIDVRDDSYIDKMWPVRMAVSPDGKLLAAAFREGMTQVWRTNDGRLVATLKQEAFISQLAFTPDGKTLLTGGEDGGLRRWNIATSEMTALFQVSAGGVTALAVSPDGRTCITGSWDGSVTIARLDTSAMEDFDGEGGWILAQLDGHGDEVISAAISPDGLYFVTGARDGAAKLWSMHSGTIIREISDDEVPAEEEFRESGDPDIAILAERKDEMIAAVFSPDGGKVLTGSANHLAKLWDANTGSLLTTFSGHAGYVKTVAFSPDGTRIATGAIDETARIWNASGGPATATFPHWVSAGSVAFSPDGDRLLTNNHHTAKEWPVSGGEALRVFEGHSSQVSRAIYSPDGAKVITASGDGSARVWDAKTGKELVTLTKPGSNAVKTVAISPDGMRVATAGDDVTFNIWPISGGDALLAITPKQGATQDIAFSSDGRWILTTTRYGGETTLWDARSGLAMQSFMRHSRGAVSVAFAPDSQRIVTAENYAAVIWEVDPLFFVSPAEQVRLACGKLKEIGVTEFSETDYRRFTILDRNAPHPCARHWSASNN